MPEDEIVGWHHRCPSLVDMSLSKLWETVKEGQGNLVCCNT